MLSLFGHCLFFGGLIGALQDGLCTLLVWVFAIFLYGWFEEKSKSFSQNFLIGLERGLARGGGGKTFWAMPK